MATKEIQNKGNQDNDDVSESPDYELVTIENVKEIFSKLAEGLELPGCENISEDEITTEELISILSGSPDNNITESSSNRRKKPDTEKKLVTEAVEPTIDATYCDEETPLYPILRSYMTHEQYCPNEPVKPRLNSERMVICDEVLRLMNEMQKKKLELHDLKNESVTPIPPPLPMDTSSTNKDWQDATREELLATNMDRWKTVHQHCQKHIKRYGDSMIFRHFLQHKERPEPDKERKKLRMHDLLHQGAPHNGRDAEEEVGTAPFEERERYANSSTTTQAHFVDEQGLPGRYQGGLAGQQHGPLENGPPALPEAH